MAVSNPRALVVDDSVSMRRLLAELLETGGYDVVSLGTAEEALEAHDAKPFDLMLLDWTLPKMSGLELTRAVRETKRGEDPYVIVVTGRNQPADLEAVLDAGASDYIAKPIDPGLLATRLTVAERHVRATRQQRGHEAQLLYADRMASVGVLAAGVAHELNNPLAYVLTSLGLARDELERELDGERLERVRTQVDEALDGARRMANIVRDLRTFSSEGSVREEPLDVRSVVKATVRLCWNELRHRATLEEELEDVPYVSAPRGALGQAVLNLLLNAIQALPEESKGTNRIRVATYTERDAAVIEVEDNGEGIPTESHGRIFDPFYTTRSSSEGTGLGLAICKNVVSSIGGTIELHSQPGQGTRFRVRLPGTDAEPKSMPPPRPAPSIPARVGPGRIVIVDDEPILARSLARVLRGQEVTIFEHGQDALEHFDAGHDAAVILCDLMMPEMSGMELFTALEERRPELLERVVFMTGGAFTPNAESFVRQTGRPVLEKPFDLAKVRATVEGLLGTDDGSD